MRSLKFLTTGTIINSWISILLSAWAPPFITFIKGIGILTLPLLRYVYNSLFSNLAAAFIEARETANIALAPNLLLLLVPSSPISNLSIATCSNSIPTKLFLIIVFTLLTAFKTPNPK